MCESVKNVFICTRRKETEGRSLGCKRDVISRFCIMLTAVFAAAAGCILNELHRKVTAARRWQFLHASAASLPILLFLRRISQSVSRWFAYTLSIQQAERKERLAWGELYLGSGCLEKSALPRIIAPLRRSPPARTQHVSLSLSLSPLSPVTFDWLDDS